MNFYHWLNRFLNFKQHNKNKMKKYLIVGLGNIGEKYTETRHNIGFKIVDYIAKEHECTFKTEKLADVTNFKFKGRQVYLVKPNTYMNLSGKAVKYWATKHKISIENILIISDDIHLPFLKIKLKPKGSAGGHNGLKDIESKLGTQQYARLRFGVGSEFSKGRQADYVLGNWTKEETNELPFIYDKIHKGILNFITIGVGKTMNELNKN
jgi:PTH1 family peptidyl-tRNA hydrolase